MKIIFPLLLLIIMLSGSGVISQFFMIFQLKKEKSKLKLLFLLLNIFIIAFLNFIYLFILDNESINYKGVTYSLIFLKSAAIITLIYYIIDLTHCIFDIGKNITFLFRLVSFGLIIGLVLIFPTDIINRSSKSILNPYLDLIYLSVILSHFYSTFILVIRFNSISNKNDRIYLFQSYLSGDLLVILTILMRTGITERIFAEQHLIAMNLIYYTIYFTWLIFSFNYGIKSSTDIPHIKVENKIKNESIEKFYLSKREEEVASLMIEGLPNKDIADKLSISLSTIKTHTNRIYRKTNTNNRIELLHKISRVD